MKSKYLFLSILPILLSVTGCQKGEEKQYLTLWNDITSSVKGGATNPVSELKEFVSDATNPGSTNFIPVEDRIATFDMDGTFVGELYPSYFEYNMLEYRVLDDVDYKDVAPEFVRETANDIRNFVRYGKKLPRYNEEFGFDIKHAKAAAEAYSGMTLKEFDDYVTEYAKNDANGFKNMKYKDSFYKPMLEVFDYLNANNFTCYVVSGSDRFICRALVKDLNIDPKNVIGMDVELKTTLQGETDGVNYTMQNSSEDYLIRTNNLLIKNLKTNKVKQIAQEKCW